MWNNIVENVANFYQSPSAWNNIHFQTERTSFMKIYNEWNEVSCPTVYSEFINVVMNWNENHALIWIHKSLSNQKLILVIIFFKVRYGKYFLYKRQSPYITIWISFANRNDMRKIFIEVWPIICMATFGTKLIPAFGRDA